MSVSPISVDPLFRSAPVALPREVVLPLNETKTERWVYTCLCAAVVIAFFLSALAYWAPAHPGVDQNGYLVGAKMMTQTG